MRPDFNPALGNPGNNVFVSGASDEPFEELLERLVRVRTGGRIRNLKVEITNSPEGRTAILQGTSTTYYLKQLAQHALQEFPLKIENGIEVR